MVNNIISYAEEMAKKYYPADKYEHAMRVAAYVRENNMITDNERENSIALAIMHDLLEDTEYQLDDNLDAHFNECLQLVTKPEDMEYIEYIKRVRQQAGTHREAYWVKLADMKDHLALTDTLTERLKEKYLRALPYLL